MDILPVKRKYIKKSKSENDIVSDPAKPKRKYVKKNKEPEIARQPPKPADFIVTFD